MRKKMIDDKILWIFVLVLACSTGCNRQSGRVTTYPVEGTVTVDDVVAENVTIQLLPEDDTSEEAVGFSDKNGKFKLTSLNGFPEKGAMEGTYKVTFSQTIRKKLSKPVYDPSVGVMTDTIIRNGLPRIYHEAETTPFTVTVTKGKNTFEFPLKSK